jgi:hypothetical protein
MTVVDGCANSADDRECRDRESNRDIAGSCAPEVTEVDAKCGPKAHDGKSIALLRLKTYATRLKGHLSELQEIGGVKLTLYMSND